MNNMTIKLKIKFNDLELGKQWKQNSVQNSSISVSQN